MIYLLQFLVFQVGIGSALNNKDTCLVQFASAPPNPLFEYSLKKTESKKILFFVVIKQIK